MALILIVDDSPTELHVMQKALERHGYRVAEASNGLEGMDVLRSFAGPIHLLLTDVVMPELSGPQLVHRIHSINADVRCIYMSGYTPEQIREKGAGDPGCEYLRKPFTSDMLLSAVRRQLASC